MQKYNQIMFSKRACRLVPASVFMLFIGCSSLAMGADLQQSLAGRWRFALDRQDVGVTERWFNRRLPDTIRLPGSLPAQGIGDEITVDTPWNGGIADRSFFTAPEFEQYRRPGHIKVP